MTRLFSESSLRRVHVPVAIVVGAADPIVPAATEAGWAAPLMPGASLTILAGKVVHYTFLDECTPLGLERASRVCREDPSVDRAAIHTEVAVQAARFFDRTLH